MSRRPPSVAFWGSALGVALAFALAALLLMPYEALRLQTSADRWGAWLLTLWTAGVMCVLFGVSGLLAFVVPAGMRDVVEAGSVTGALDSRRRAREQAGETGFHRNFAWWLVCTGAILVVIYFTAWTILQV